MRLASPENAASGLFFRAPHDDARTALALGRARAREAAGRFRTPGSDAGV